MASRDRRSDAAQAHGRGLTGVVLRELRNARIDRNLSGAVIAGALGMSAAQYSRLERGLVAGVTIERAAVALDAVGLRLSVGVYPAGPPMRDRAHARLIERLRLVCDRTVRLLTEVPLPDQRDGRAWDVVLIGPGWRHRVEAETRPRDRQALERRIALKVRDGGDDGGVSLLLLDSRHNREFVALNADALADRFPVPQQVALAALADGRDPGQGSLILL